MISLWCDLSPRAVTAAPSLAYLKKVTSRPHSQCKINASPSTLHLCAQTTHVLLFSQSAFARFSEREHQPNPNPPEVNSLLLPK